MQLKQTSKEFRIKFLLTFTKELIKNTKTSAILELENTLRRKLIEELASKGADTSISNVEEISLKEKIKTGINLEAGELTRSQIRSEEFGSLSKTPHKRNTIPRGRRSLRIPKPKLPPHLRYLHPTITNIQIDLGKLNPLLKDINVNTIESQGPDQKIMVSGAFGTKPTAIVLTKEEIDEVLSRFSKTAKIPISEEGAFSVATGSLTISALISKTTGSKFIIKKLHHMRR